MRHSKVFALASSLLLVGAISLADYVTGYEIRLAILYLVPILWATWSVGAKAGAWVAAASTVCWMIVFESLHFYANPVYFYLEGAILGLTFLIIVWLLARLRAALEHSDARTITVLEGLDAAVEVKDAASGERLYENQRFHSLFGARGFSGHGSEVHDAASDRWYALRSRDIRWTDGRAAKLLMLSDITEEHTARDVLARQREVAHRTSKLVALGEFASAVAHELNQPLAAATTYNDACLRLLESGQYDIAEIEEAMRKCRDQARRAGAILKRLREVLRHPVHERTRVDMVEVARMVCELAQPEALAAGVALEVEQAVAAPKAHTDRLLVEQVASNLVRNAIEAVQDLPPERRRVVLSVTAGPGEGVTLAVADQGDGVPEEVRARLFEAFVTTKTEGLGLGLSICRSVIESLGGAIDYREGERGGARFSFCLPAEAAVAAKTGSSTSSGAAATAPNIGFSLRKTAQ